MGSGGLEVVLGTAAPCFGSFLLGHHWKRRRRRETSPPPVCCPGEGRKSLAGENRKRAGFAQVLKPAGASHGCSLPAYGGCRGFPLRLPPRTLLCPLLQQRSAGGALQANTLNTQIYFSPLYPSLPSHVFRISSAPPCPLHPSCFGLSLADRCGVPGTGPLLPRVRPRRGIAAAPELRGRYINPPHTQLVDVTELCPCP